MSSANRLLLRRALITWAIGLWVVICVLSLLPGNERPHTGASGNVEHLMAYTGTGFVTALAFRRIGVLWLTLPFCVAAGLFELAQIFILGRSAGIDNWAASSFGALLGVTIARYIVSLGLRGLRMWKQ